MKKGTRVGGVTKIDPGAQKWLDGGARNPATVTRKQRKDRARGRAKYDLDRLVIEAVKVAAGRVNTSYSQLAEFLLAWAITEWIEGGELWDAVHESKSRASAIRFDWDLELPEDVIETLEGFAQRRDS